jgi:hypothetical protein
MITIMLCAFTWCGIVIVSECRCKEVWYCLCGVCVFVCLCNLVWFVCSLFVFVSRVVCVCVVLCVCRLSFVVFVVCCVCCVCCVFILFVL